MDVKTILNRCYKYGGVLTPEGNNLQVSAPLPLPDDLRMELREHKDELLQLLKPNTVADHPQWHAETIAAAVQKEGICIFWSDIFSEIIAFYLNDSFKNNVPCGIVAYSNNELWELFGKGKPGLQDRDLILIHEAKKIGGHIISHVTKEEEGKGQ